MAGVAQMREGHFVGTCASTGCFDGLSSRPRFFATGGCAQGSGARSEARVERFGGTAARKRFVASRLKPPVDIVRLVLHRVFVGLRRLLRRLCRLRQLLVRPGLSFLGLGVQPPLTSLGNMVGYGREYITRAPWIMLAPAAVIVLTTLSISLLGDWLRDKLDPTLR